MLVFTPNGMTCVSARLVTDFISSDMTIAWSTHKRRGASDETIPPIDFAPSQEVGSEVRGNDRIPKLASGKEGTVPKESVHDVVVFWQEIQFEQLPCGMQKGRQTAFID